MTCRARSSCRPIYDLANRGLLPPGFALTGFARRDWADEDFGDVVYKAVKEHARTPFRQEVWDQLAEGIRFVPGHLRRRRRLRHARRHRRRAGPRPGHRRQPRLLPVHPAGRVPGGAQAALAVRAGRHTDGDQWRRVVIEKPFGHDLESRARAQRHRQRRLPRGVGVPHRPLPRQGDGAEPAGAALRQPAVRADLERQLRRPRADHHGRGHRRRRPGRLLRRHRRGPRRHPEPPAAADGADRDGGAALLPPARPARGEDQGALRGHRLAEPIDETTARGQYVGGWQGGQKVLGLLAGGRRSPRTRSPRPTPRSRSRSTPAAGPGCRSTCAPASGSAAGSPRSRSSSSAPRTCPSTRPTTEELGQNALVVRVQPDEGVTHAVRLQGARAPAWRSATSRWTSATATAFTEASPEAYERLHPRRPARRAVAVPHQRPRSSCPGGSSTRSIEHWAPRGLARRLRRGHLGPALGRRAPLAHRRTWPSVWRTPVIVDLPSHRHRRRSTARWWSCARAAAPWPSAGCSPSSSSPRTGPRPRTPSRPPTTPAASTRAACIVLARGHPARRASRLDAQIRVGGDAGASEVIVLRLYGPLADHGGSVVVPLLLPDAPVVAWWPGEPPERAVPRTRSAAWRSRRITDAADDASPRRRSRSWPGTTARATPTSPGPASPLARPARRGARPAAVRGRHPRRGLRGGGLRRPRTCWPGGSRARCACPVERTVAEVPGAAFGRSGSSAPRAGRAPPGRQQDRPRSRSPASPTRRVALARRTVRECLAEELRRLDPDEIFREALENVPRTGSRRSSRAKAKA